MLREEWVSSTAAYGSTSGQETSIEKRQKQETEWSANKGLQSKTIRPREKVMRNDSDRGEKRTERESIEIHRHMR